jgi:hypothetical protein
MERQQLIDAYKIRFSCSGCAEHSIDTLIDYNAPFQRNLTSEPLCTGRRISLWGNGNLHIKGSFNQGIPYDTLLILNQDNSIEKWCYFDIANKTVWYFNDDGTINYSSSFTDYYDFSGPDKTYYNSQGIRTKIIEHARAPASYWEKITYCDSLGNKYSSYSDADVLQFGLRKSKKLHKYLHDNNISYRDMKQLNLIQDGIVYIFSPGENLSSPRDLNDLDKESIHLVVTSNKKHLLFHDSKNKEIVKIRYK